MTAPRHSAAGGRSLGMGMTFLIEAGLFTALGWWLDEKWGTTPWLLIAMTPVGVTLATYHLLRIVAPKDRESAE